VSTNPETVTALAVMQTKANALAKAEPIVAALAEAGSIGTGFRITSADDNDLATLSRGKLKAGLKAVKDGLAAAFKEYEALYVEPYKADRKRAEAFFAPVLTRLDGAVQQIDLQMLAFVRAEEARVVRERREAQVAADAAARAAAEAQKAAEECGASEEEMPPPGVPQVIAAPPAPVVTHTAIGTASATVKTSPVKCEVAPGDRAERIREIARQWPHLLVLDEAKARAEFAALQARGDAEKPSEAGTVVAGIRFYVTRLVSGGASR
jgi:hypothetical protein